MTLRAFRWKYFRNHSGFALSCLQQIPGLSRTPKRFSRTLS